MKAGAANCDLLARVLKVAETQLDKPANTTVTADTVHTLEDEVRKAAAVPSDAYPRDVDDDCAMLLQCLRRAVWARDEQHEDEALKWETIAKALRPHVRLAWARACSREAAAPV